MTEPTDFTHCERVPNRAYNGANGKKIAYVDFFHRHAGDFLAPSLACIVPRIDLAAITTFIAGLPCLSDLQRTFYRVYLTDRYEAFFVRQKVGDRHSASFYGILNATRQTGNGGHTS